MEEQPKTQLVPIEAVRPQRTLAVRLAERATPEQNDALRNWLAGLLKLQGGNLSKIDKARQALILTWKSKIILPTVKLIGTEVKRHGWDNRTKSQRFGLSGAALGVALFGGQGAGIAALGTAVGVPLWIVMGAGSMFARSLLDELGRKADSADNVKSEVKAD